MKMLWKGIKNIVSLIPTGLDRISHLKDSKGSLIKDPEKIANEFNQFFANVASDITKKIPRNPKSPLSYLPNPNLNSFFISPCTSEEVSLVTQSLKNGKSSGPNSIPIKLLKILDPWISVVLSTLISESLKQVLSLVLNIVFLKYMNCYSTCSFVYKWQLNGSCTGQSN